MPKRHSTKPILLEGKYLHTWQPLEIIDITSRPLRRRYEVGTTFDADRNRNIIAAFAGKLERTSSEIIAAFSTHNSDWSEQFHALRAGESLGWAVEHGIVERIGFSHQWRLLESERQFEIIGGHGKERSLRVRGHTDGAEAIVAQKLWAREQKRRERSRLRDIEKHRPHIVRQLDRITRDAPETKLPKSLQRFAVAGFDDVGSCRQYIIDSLGDLQRGDALMIELELDKLSWAIPRQPRPEAIPAEDLAAMGEIQL